MDSYMQWKGNAFPSVAAATNPDNRTDDGAGHDQKRRVFEQRRDLGVDMWQSRMPCAIVKMAENPARKEADSGALHHAWKRAFATLYLESLHCVERNR